MEGASQDHQVAKNYDDFKQRTIAQNQERF
jgi:hypothetical protein